MSKFVGTLPHDLPAALFVVLHIPPHSPSHLPEILNRCGPLRARHPVDGEKIEQGCIYVAPPDRHLILENNHILVRNGPKENRFRPSVDALFRSAAYVFGPRVIGMVLSGALDDGTSGLWTIKRRGGLSVIQDLNDAEFPHMPANAREQVEVDHSVPAAEMGALLATLVGRTVPRTPKHKGEERELLELEVSIAQDDGAFEKGIMEMGHLSPFTCPECHGALVRLEEGGRIRFRCHTGHAFSASALLAGVTQANEEALWKAMRGFEEAAMLLEHLSRQFKELKDHKAAALFREKAREVKDRARVIHDSVLNTELLSEDTRRENRPGVVDKEPIGGKRAGAADEPSRGGPRSAA